MIISSHGNIDDDGDDDNNHDNNNTQLYGQNWTTCMLYAK